jgi:hypothetical protein
MIPLDFSGIQLKLREDENGKLQVFDPVRKNWFFMTPEEHVRQYLLRYLTEGMEYPAGRMAVEKKIFVGKIAKRFDITVYDGDHRPWMLVECKEPEVMISEATLFQLLNYQRTIQCRYWLLTNGHQTFCADAGNIMEIKWLEQLPVYER